MANTRLASALHGSVMDRSSYRDPPVDQSYDCVTEHPSAATMSDLSLDWSCSLN